MLRQICSALFLVAAPALSISFARADPPASMIEYRIPTPVIACDTRDEMGTIIQAIKNGTLKETLGQFAKLKDESGEPACILSPLGTVVFGNSEHIGRIKDHDTTVDAWISNVGNWRTGFYVLWGELVKEDDI